MGGCVCLCSCLGWIDSVPIFWHNINANDGENRVLCACGSAQPVFVVQWRGEWAVSFLSHRPYRSTLRMYYNRKFTPAISANRHFRTREYWHKTPLTPVASGQQPPESAATSTDQPPIWSHWVWKTWIDTHYTITNWYGKFIQYQNHFKLLWMEFVINMPMAWQRAATNTMLAVRPDSVNTAIAMRQRVIFSVFYRNGLSLCTLLTLCHSTHSHSIVLPKYLFWAEH